MKHETTKGTRATIDEQLLDELLPASLSDDLNATQSTGGSHQAEHAPPPRKLGRYVISDLLGAGAFGSVFKALDEQLQRDVAIKVPHTHRLSSPQAIEKYLDEARTLAKMEYPNVVAVYDVGVTDEGLPYIVSAFVDGTNLAERMRSNPLSLKGGLQLAIDLGRALAYVHAQGIVHRDIKPANILLHPSGKPFLADFGLALRDELSDGRYPRVGTPAYMSPEQARGESHLVDGRSDIFSLGIVLYEMLVGKRPFRGRDRDSIVDSLLNQEPAPLRQHNPSLPRDLERICSKALAKRASQRYSSATDLVEDLEYFLATCSSDKSVNDDSARQSKLAEPSQYSEQVSEVIPRGLRSYDRHDANFFCRLLPGPLDREWVPESLRFWQRQIESNDALDPLRVGVLYGPSGCGKSSFVKAGLLPLLEESTTTVFIEATRADTESRLLRGLRRKFPQLRPDGNLPELMLHIRKEHELEGKGRLLIVIDQFEQWLHGRADETDPELATALRQCDGHVIQCLLLVRDDFWLALSRFMSALEVPLRQNHNTSLVDLFSPRHARRVLADFGVAYDKLPPNIKQFTPEQNLFLDRVVEDLCEGEKIFPVRLALFVEMIKTQPWDIGTLRDLGGIHGIGLQFLEEAFSSDLAPAAQRVHETAVRKVLRALLPDQGVDIKGNMQSEHLLREISGYEDPAKFEEMIRILDNDLRLISPTDPTGTVASDESLSQSGDGTYYYQLTHDYLVPAVKQWLTRRQRATRRGRAELRLAEYANLWATKPTPKFAPSWIDWLSISLWTSSKHWSSIERKMMRSTTRRHVWRTTGFSIMMILLVSTAWVYWQRNVVTSLVQQLQTARTADISPVLKEIHSYGSLGRHALQNALDTSRPDSRAELINRVGLLKSDPAQREILVRQGSMQDIQMLLVMREHLQPLDRRAIDLLTSIVEAPNEASPSKLGAALLLAGDQPGPGDSFWTRNAGMIVSEMLQRAASQPQDVGHIVEGVTPIAEQLVDALREITAEPVESSRRRLATAYLVQCLIEKPADLLDFLLDATAEQHETILPVLAEKLPPLSGKIHQVALTEIDPNLPETEYDTQARRKGTAAALLHRLESGEATWPLLRHSERPNARSYFIHRIAPLGGDFEVILARYSRESDVSVRRALLNTLGTFSWEAVPAPLRLRAIALAKDAFENDPDSGIHSMSEWALRRWDEIPWLQTMESSLAKRKPDSRKNWFINAEGQTMAIMDARSVPEIGYVFAICTKEVNVGQFLRYRPDHRYFENRSPTLNSPVGLVNWLDCIGYCRWLSQELRADPENSYPEELIAENEEFPYDGVAAGGAYRLPTDLEWQFACASGTTCPRYYGSSDLLADHYYVYYETSVLSDGQSQYFPGGHKKPNDFGVFAMYDGVREWGHEKKGDRRPILGGTSSQNIFNPVTIRVPPAADLVLARNGFYGFRVAQTLVAP